MVQERLITSSSASTDGGTRVAGGRHAVPPGVFVERLHDTQHDKLLHEDARSAELMAFLQSRGTNVAETYDKLLSRIVKKGCVVSGWGGGGGGKWSEPKLVKIVKESRPVFEEEGLSIALCLCRQLKEAERFRWLWLEVFDKAGDLPSYSSPFDVTDYRPVAGLHIIPPDVVVAEVLSEFDPGKVVRECPAPVRRFMEARGLMGAYEALVQALYDTKGTRSSIGSWKTSKLLEILGIHTEDFRRRGVDVVVCKAEIAKWEYAKWIEFVDRDAAGSALGYWSPYDVNEAEMRRQTSERSLVGSVRRLTTVGDNGGTGGGNGNGVGMVKETLLVHGRPQVRSSSEPPPELVELLEKRDLLEQYSLLDVAFSATKNIKNFLDVWRLVGEKIVSFAPVEDFQSTFLDKGVRILLCESVGRGGATNCWLEYVDEQVLPNYDSPFSIVFESVSSSGFVSLGESEGGGRQPQNYKKVAGGRHLVPFGVAVKGLDEFTKVTDDCPRDVLELLSRKGLVPAYEDFIHALAKTRSTRGYISAWKGHEILKVMENFVGIFLDKGVKMVLCKIKPDSGKSYRWFEFIDIGEFRNYVPQYDMSNYGDSELDTLSGTLRFPKGVAIEPLVDKKSLVEQIPQGVQELLEARDCFDLYVALVDVLCESGELDIGNGFSENQVRTIAKILSPKFEAKGVAIFYSAKPQTDRQGNYQTLHWLEFVDRTLQPNYCAQRGVDVCQFPSEGISTEEAVDMALKAAFAIAMIGLEFGT